MDLLRAIEAEDVETVAQILSQAPQQANFYDQKNNEFPLGVAARVGLSVWYVEFKL